MTEQPANDRLVEALRIQGFLTEDQARRVQHALESGKDLVWALSHVPLVEPLQFLKAQSQAGKSHKVGRAGLTPLPAGQIYEVKPLPTGPDTPTPLPTGVMGVSDSGLLDLEGEDDVPTLEIEDKDYAEGFEGVGRPMDVMVSMEEGEAPTLHTPLPRRNRGTLPITEKGTTPSPDAFIRPGVAPPTYDLTDDEGIPLVNRVNAMLAEAVGGSVRRLIFRPVPGGIEVATISEYGTDGLTQALEADEGTKICHRLKIMARIEPWRKPPQKGIFHLHHSRRQARVLVDIIESPAAAGVEEITLHFLPTF